MYIIEVHIFVRVRIFQSILGWHNMSSVKLVSQFRVSCMCVCVCVMVECTKTPLLTYPRGTPDEYVRHLCVELW